MFCIVTALLARIDADFMDNPDMAILCMIQLGLVLTHHEILTACRRPLRLLPMS